MSKPDKTCACGAVMKYGRYRQRQDAGIGRDMDGDYPSRPRVKGWMCETCGRFEAD